MKPRLGPRHDARDGLSQTTPIITALGRWRHKEDHRSKAILGYIMSLEIAWDA